MKRKIERHASRGTLPRSPEHAKDAGGSAAQSAAPNAAPNEAAEASGPAWGMQAVSPTRPSTADAFGPASGRPRGFAPADFAPQRPQTAGGAGAGAGAETPSRLSWDHTQVS